jgi:hypothetical protein
MVNTGHGTSPNRVGGASPRPKRDVLSAAFSAPERFKETQKFVVAPSVGHYRPKYGAVEHAVVSGQIDPVALTKRRVPPLELVKDPVPQMTTVMTGARDEVRPLAVKEREARRAQRAAELAAGVDDDDNDLLTKRRSAGPPTATRTSSPAFRSKVAAVELAAHPTAAPDAMYYPAAENGTMHSARSHVEFAKQTPRPPMSLNAILPEPRSQLTAFSKEAARNAPDIAKYSPRSNGPRRRVADAPLDVQRADGLRYERPRAADFTNSLSPRGEEDSRPAIRVGVSVEEVPALNHPSDRRAPASNFTTMLIRRDPKPPVDLPPLDLSLDAVSPRTRTVQMRSDAVGHRDFWNSALNTEVGAYAVDLESIRAKHLRNFDFGKGLSRIDARANIADLTYDVKVPSPRVQGNPMIAQQVSRVKREAVLAAKSGAADVTYDVRPPPLWPAGAIDFSRHVDRHTHVAGRGHPSERMRDRERHETEASAAVASGHASARRTEY